MANELGALGALALRAAGGLTGRIEELHWAIARRSFDGVGAGSAPARAAHDGIAGAVYGGLRRASDGLGRAAVRVEGGRPLSASPRGALALAALNGFLGDDLEREGSPLALPMTIRAGGRDVPPAELAAAFPDATAQVAVFVHGLCESDTSWRFRPRGSHGPVATYGERLEDDLGLTPVYLRYNTGLHVSENGRRLAGLMEELVEQWPVAVERIVLVGHSMGGLVARSACHQGHCDGQRWTTLVREVVCLGSPHLGAPLEKAANLAAWALAALPETKPMASIVNVRSEGIKDLRFGALVEDDLRDCDPHAPLEDRCTDVPFLETADHYFIGATLARDRDDPLGYLAGDLLVRYASASGSGRGKRRIPFEVDRGGHIGGITHFDLLNHPEVYETLRGWLSPPAPAGPAAG